MTRKLGFSFLYFAPKIGEQHVRWFARAAHHGYSGVELPILEANASDLAMLRRAAAGEGLRTTAVGFCTPDTNPIAEDARTRAASVEHLRSLIDRSAELGAQLLAGPLHSAYGSWTGHPPTRDEFARSVEALQIAAQHAEQYGIRLAIEPLNRFESYFLTTAADCLALVEAIDHPSVVCALDTHHAHIEEGDTPAAIRATGASLGHVQLSENHRGTPGTGQIQFAAVLQALHAIDYEGWIVIEAFSRQSPPFGSLLHIWRELDDGPEDVMKAGAAIAAR